MNRKTEYFPTNYQKEGFNEAFQVQGYNLILN
jgi:hypothetical protein